MERKPITPRTLNRQVWVDLDGVLADFDAHYHREFGVKLDRNGEEPADLWQNIRTREMWFESLPLMPGALALWDALKPYKPKILTGLSPEKFAAGGDQKRRWVARHFGDDVEVVVCRSKHKCQHGQPGDILIDDWHKYSHLWNGMGGIFVMHRTNTETLTIVHALMSDALLTSPTGVSQAQEVSTEDAMAQAENALLPFSWIGDWLFARDIPDDELLVAVKTTIGTATPLTRGHFKAASNARMALIKARKVALSPPREVRASSEHDEEKNDLGAVSATEGDALPCSVPTGKLPHDGDSK